MSSIKAFPDENISFKTKNTQIMQLMATVVKQFGDNYYNFSKYIKFIDPKNKIMSKFKRKFLI